MKYLLKAVLIDKNLADNIAYRSSVYTTTDTLEHSNQNESYEFTFYSKIPKWYTTKVAMLKLANERDLLVPEHWAYPSRWITKPKGKHDPHVSYRLHVQRVINGVPTKVSTSHPGETSTSRTECADVCGSSSSGGASTSACA